MSMPPIPQDCLEQSRAWIAASAPATLISIGDPEHPLLAQIPDAAAIQHCHVPANAASWPSAPTNLFDAGLILCALEQVSKPVAGTILARLRDQLSKRLLVMVRVGDRWEGLHSHWQQTDLLAYGLRRLGRYHAQGRPIHLYCFDLFDYKPVPDWLNARHWANPEQWGKHRW